MTPPSSLPQPLHRLPEDRIPGRPPAPPSPLRLPPIGVPVRIPAAMEPAHRPAAAAGTSRPPGGEHPGRLPGPEGPDPRASGAAAPGPTAAFELPALPAAVGTARRVLRDLLTAWGIAEPARDDAVLVASELVTNALVHAAGERIVCRVRSTADRVRLEVEDQNRGSARPVPRRSGPDDQNGRGLFLVDALSVDWGVTLAPDRPARVVWADLPTAPEPPAPTCPIPSAPLPRTVPHSSEGAPPHAPADPRPRPARRPVLDPDPSETGSG
ncbi:ATP-binding protein [Streptomyces diastatochromogenes]|uniref:ATP-binding protein n=1 Tax=Streptomyces diastatochromogenes TaxID=42236 RepID=UPI0036AE2341